MTSETTVNLVVIALAAICVATAVSAAWLAIHGKPADGLITISAGAAGALSAVLARTESRAKTGTTATVTTTDQPEPQSEATT